MSPENARYIATERYSFGWTDYRAVYGSPSRRIDIPWALIEDIAGRLIGTFIITAPIAFVSYWVWRYMGWM